MLLSGNFDRNEGQLTVAYIDTNNKQTDVMMSKMHQQGFSLIELMVVLGIVAIMASIAVPSFTRMIRGQTVVGASGGLMSAFNIARSEAIRRGVSITICPTTDPKAVTVTCSGSTEWASGWLIYPTGAANITASLIQVGMGTAGVQMTASTAAVLSFDKRGLPSVATATVNVDAVPCSSGVDKRVVVGINAAGHLTSIGGFCP